MPKAWERERARRCIMTSRELSRRMLRDFANESGRGEETARSAFAFRRGYILS